MKTTGILADNYKLEKFKKELTSQGITDFKITPFQKGVSLIQVKISDDQVILFAKICQYVDLYYKRLNLINGRSN
jgi:hypothetical protein